MQIDRRIIDELSGLAPEAVREDEPMSKHTSFGLGGPVDVFVEPADEAAFMDAAAFLADEGVPTLILGRGTNILVRSGGLEGAVLCAKNAFAEIARTEDGLQSGSGVALSKVLTLCSEEGLTGLEGLAGIPGSVGGAVKTNAGSFGDTIGGHLAEIVTFQPGKSAVVVPADELAIEYRRTQLPEGAIVSLVRLRLEEAPPEDVERRRKETLEKKWRSQPTGMRSAGCIFRNPPGGSAGRMIDETGLKGTRVGGAVVSDLHAGFILNDRGATADEVEELISIVRSRVLEETGIELVLEIEVVGRRSH